MPDANALRPEDIQKSLEAARLGKKIHYFPEIDSTNRFAFSLASKGGEEGEVVIAESQSDGKGRLGRSWFSPPGVNLYLSIILRPKLAPADAAQLTLMSAVAVAETVKCFLGAPPAIKWPNDILVAGKKIAGILTESSIDRARLHFAVIGVGVNVNVTAELLPEEIRGRATSLRILKNKPVDRTAFAGELIRSLDRCYGELEQRGFPWIAGCWESFFELKGRRVKVEMGDRLLSGTVRGIDGAGALVVENDDGALERVIAGDVIPVGP